MKTYISHLFEDQELKNLINEYKDNLELGIETIDFAAGMLDRLQ